MIVERCPTGNAFFALALGQCLTSEMEDLGLAVLSNLSKKHGHLPHGIVFDWNPIEWTGGGYSPRKDILYVNLVHLRTARDLVFVMAHEYCHLLQQRKYGTEAILSATVSVSKMREENDVQAAFYDYLKSDIEKEADAFAFDFEDSFGYKNRIVNRCPPVSFFVARKHLIDFAPK